MGKKYDANLLGILDQALKFKYDDHCRRLLGIAQNNRSSISPKKTLPLLEILKKFNADTGKEIRQYGDTLRSEILRIVADTQSRLNERDKNLILETIDKYLTPELYTNRFQGMLTA